MCAHIKSFMPKDVSNRLHLEGINSRIFYILPKTGLVVFLFFFSTKNCPTSTPQTCTSSVGGFGGGGED